jgi:3-oxoacyl-[acyl-carrier protein] reductase
MRFKGKALFATGAGSGIAAATARRFSADGGRVAVVDLDEDRAAGVAAELSGSIALGCDVSDEHAVEQALAQASDQLGRIDCVLNAAGHAAFASLEQFELADWNRMLAVHLTGTFVVCKAALPHLRAVGGGSIVNVSSSVALIGRSNLGAYSAAKGAVLAFSRQLAVDVAADNVRVNAIAPGAVRTGLTEPRWVERGGGDYSKGAAAAVSDTIQKRVAEPSELAAPICFLFSDDASFMTGSLLVADGGQTAI